MRLHLSIIFVLVGLIALSPVAVRGQLLGIGGDGKLSEPLWLKVTTPMEGSTQSGGFAFEGILNGGPTEPLTVEIRVFDVSHYLPVEERIPLLGTYPNIELKDELLPVTEGSHTMQISIRKSRNGDLLMEQRVPFTVSKPPGLDRELDHLRDRLAELGPPLESAEKAYAVAKRYGGQGPDSAATLADRLHAERVAELFGRVRVYVELAEILERHLEPERALETLNFARRIFESERDRAADHPTRPGAQSLDVPRRLTVAPAYFDGLARFYVRRGDLKEALSWWEQEAKWYEIQLRRSDLDPRSPEQCRTPDDPWSDKSDCYTKAARPYTSMAHACFLLTNDRSASEANFSKARSIRPR